MTAGPPWAPVPRPLRWFFGVPLTVVLVITAILPPVIALGILRRAPREERTEWIVVAVAIATIYLVLVGSLARTGWRLWRRRGTDGH